jgi:hypothetical protein
MVTSRPPAPVADKSFTLGRHRYIQDGLHAVNRKVLLATPETGDARLDGDGERQNFRG